MNLWYRYSIASISLVLSTLYARSQSQIEIPRTAETRLDTSRFTSVVFDKNLTTYRWNGLAKYSNNYGLLSLQFSEQFLSSLIITDQKLIRDEHDFNLSLRNQWDGNIKGTLKASLLSVSDNKSTILGNTSSSTVYGGIVYMPWSSIIIEPLLGVHFDNQFNQHDSGPSYMLSLASDSLDYNGYETTINGMVQYDQLTPRTLYTHTTLLNIHRGYFEETQNSFQLQYYGNRRDFYFPADAAVQQQFHVTNNIESRREESLTVSDSLDYNLQHNFIWSFQGNILARSISRTTQFKTFTPGLRTTLNTAIDELKIEGGTKATYSIGASFIGSLGFYYQERDETHTVQPEAGASQDAIDSQSRLEEAKNNHSRRASLTSSMKAALSRSQGISLLASISLLRYDTPSAANDDDRDELWYIFNLITSHRINRHLNTTVTADLNLTHLVYITSTRSANNTWNRILRLSPRLEYLPSESFTTINSFEVLANYSVYDIEYSLATARSIVFRQFSFNDSSHIGLTRRLSFEWSSTIRLYERGQLQWNTFTERPINYFDERTFIGAIRYNIEQRLIFSVGIRYFSQSRFGYTGTLRNLLGFVRNSGPMTNIFWSVSKQTELSLSGWYEIQSQTGVSKHGIANMNMSLTVRI